MRHRLDRMKIAASKKIIRPALNTRTCLVRLTSVWSSRSPSSDVLGSEVGEGVGIFRTADPSRTTHTSPSDGTAQEGGDPQAFPEAGNWYAPEELSHNGPDGEEDAVGDGEGSGGDGDGSDETETDGSEVGVSSSALALTGHERSPPARRAAPSARA